MVENPPAVQETWVRSLREEDPLEKGIAIYSSILAWRLPWTEKSCGLQYYVLCTMYIVQCKKSDMTERLTLHFR